MYYYNLICINGHSSRLITGTVDTFLQILFQMLSIQYRGDGGEWLGIAEFSKVLSAPLTKFHELKS